MPEITPRLGLEKPLGNETVSRAAYNKNLDTLEKKIALQADFESYKGEGKNDEVIKQKRLELKVDTRTTSLIYADGNLAQVVEKDGDTTVKTTTLNYDANGNLTSVVETAGGSTVTSTLNYVDGTLRSVTKAVV